MCEYCGCQQIPVINELTREHDAVVAAIGETRTHVQNGDLAAAARSCLRIAAILGPHTSVEEDGLFPFLTADFPDHISVLRSEHRRVEVVLSECANGVPRDPDWPTRLLSALDLLREHILKEQDGVFPAALVTLDPDQWEHIEDLRVVAGSGLLAPHHDHDHDHYRA